MHDFLHMAVVDSQQQGLHQGAGLSLPKMMILDNKIEKLASLQQLRDNEDSIGSLIQVINLHNVGVGHLFQNLEFSLKVPDLCGGHLALDNLFYRPFVASLKVSHLVHFAVRSWS
jgi:hypothetical protein